MNSGYLVLAAAVLLIAAGTGGYFVVRSKIRSFSREVFGTEKISDGIKRQQEEYANMPKTVAGMTSIYLPAIHRDFPDFNFAQFQKLAENLLREVLLSITAGSLSEFSGADDTLKQQVELAIESDEQKQIHHHFEKIQIHRTEIREYRKTGGVCRIILQSAVGYVAYVTNLDGKLIRGSRKNQTQTRYNMELIYVQDIEKARQEVGETALGLICPNCGAPVKVLGSKFCVYCGGAVKEIHRNVWKIHSYEEVT